MGDDLALDHQPLDVGDGFPRLRIVLRPRGDVLVVTVFGFRRRSLDSVVLVGQVADHTIGAVQVIVVSPDDPGSHLAVFHPVFFGSDCVTAGVVVRFGGYIFFVAICRRGWRVIDGVALIGRVSRHQGWTVERIVVSSRYRPQRIDGSDWVTVIVISGLVDDVQVRRAVGCVIHTRICHGWVLDSLDDPVQRIVAVVGSRLPHCRSFRRRSPPCRTASQ